MDNKEEKIRELESKINSLGDNLQSMLYQLNLLKAELREWRCDGGSVDNTSKITSVGYQKQLTRVEPLLDLEGFIGLKLIHLVGIIVLVIGISIGVKYAIDRDLISEGMRIALAYGAGIILFILSVRLKKKYLVFSAILFAGSMASIYFTTYAAFVYYHFLPGIVTFLIMMLLTAFTVFKALDYNLKEIAIIGMIGAYAIPFLVSQDSKSVKLFFSYILMINLGIVFISFKKSWQLLNKLAAIITWVIFIGWVVTIYAQPQFWTAIVFMSLYYLLFLVISFAALFRSTKVLGSVDVAQIFISNCILYLTSILLLGEEPGNSIGRVTAYVLVIVLGLSLLAYAFIQREKVLLKLLSCQVLTLLLILISVEMDGIIVTLLWIVVSILLFAVGVFRKIAWARIASVLVMGITLLKLLAFDSINFTTIQKIISYLVIGVLLLVGSFYYQKSNAVGKGGGDL